MSTISAAFSLADVSCIDPLQVIKILRLSLKYFPKIFPFLGKLRRQTLVINLLVDNKMKKVTIFCTFIFVFLSSCLQSSDNENPKLFEQPAKIGLDSSIQVSDQRVLLRQKRSIFGFLSFLIVLLNAGLAINLNMNINNNNNNG